MYVGLALLILLRGVTGLALLRVASAEDFLELLPEHKPDAHDKDADQDEDEYRPLGLASRNARVAARFGILPTIFGETLLIERTGITVILVPFADDVVCAEPFAAAGCRGML